MSEQVHVFYNDAPIRCVDVCNTVGERAIRIRPTREGALFEFTGLESAALDLEDLLAFSEALSLLCHAGIADTETPQ